MSTQILPHKLTKAMSIPHAAVDQWHQVLFCYDPRNDGLTVRLTDPIKNLLAERFGYRKRHSATGLRVVIKRFIPTRGGQPVVHRPLVLP
jgi:hypothetical protein